MKDQKPDIKKPTSIPEKKTYIKPTVKVVEIEAVQVFAPSMCGGY